MNKKKKLSNIYEQIISTHLSYVIVVFLIVALLVLSYFYYTGNLSDHTIALFGGLSASLVAVLIQFLMGWNEHREIEVFKELGIRSILSNRKGFGYYRQLLSSATNRIDVLGVTAHRFLNDFADQGSQDKALLDNLRSNQGLHVRLLLPHKDHLANPDDRDVFDAVKRKLSVLAEQFPDRFRYKYFAHPPVHSIVRVDDEAIVGPVFQETPSKHTPSIHISANSEFVTPYLNYFEHEWNSAD